MALGTACGVMGKSVPLGEVRPASASPLLPPQLLVEVDRRTIPWLENRAHRENTMHSHAAEAGGLPGTTGAPQAAKVQEKCQLEISFSLRCRPSCASATGLPHALRGQDGPPVSTRTAWRPCSTVGPGAGSGAGAGHALIACLLFKDHSLQVTTQTPAHIRPGGLPSPSERALFSSPFRVILLPPFSDACICLDQPHSTFFPTLKVSLCQQNPT